jgi:hypothetical protein
MNLREGTRRLALFLGLIGAIAGGFVAYLELQTTLEQRARHNRFEQLANPLLVQQARKSCFENSAPSEHGPWEKYQTPQESVTPVTKGEMFVPPYCFIPIDDPNAADFTPSELNNGGIKTVHFENREIASIETQDGQTLYPTPAPEAWQYLFVVFLPILGFFVPWGAVRAIGWVGAGFVQPRG